jgi:aspartate/methionine/tyrosine aminotransferase
LEVQDTIPVCASQIGQAAAIGALRAEASWVQDRVHGLASQISTIKAALAPLGEGAVIGGEGAIYLLCRLPARYADRDAEVVKWLAYQHGVCVIPGSACGAPGYVRVCYANLAGEAFEDACQKLHGGLQLLVDQDPSLEC